MSRPWASSGALVAAWVLLVVALAFLMMPAATSGASPGSGTSAVASPAPAASPPPVVGTGDSRSDGEGPGFVGSPVAIALGVVALGAATAVGTLVVLRIGGSRRRP